MASEYVHLELNNDITCMAGYYTPMKEVRLKYDGREVLYVVGQTVIEASCCGIGSFPYVLVPGFIVGWQKRKNENGLPVTEVEPVSDKDTLTNLRKIIRESEDILQIEFW